VFNRQTIMENGLNSEGLWIYFDDGWEGFRSKWAFEVLN
jgi:hypothetical protein